MKTVKTQFRRTVIKNLEISGLDKKSRSPRSSAGQPGSAPPAGPYDPVMDGTTRLLAGDLCALDLPADPDWVKAIEKAYAERRTQALRMGRITYAARRALKRGKFSEMAESGKLPLSKRLLEEWSLIGRVLGDLDSFAHHSSQKATEANGSQLPFANNGAQITPGAGETRAAEKVVAHNRSQIPNSGGSIDFANNGAQIAPGTGEAADTLSPQRGEGRGEGWPTASTGTNQFANNGSHFADE